MPNYKLEKYASALGSDQWVVLPQSNKELPRPATNCEVSLWHAWQHQKALYEQFHAGNRARFAERIQRSRSERGMER